jgi:hypothetical protein
LRTILLSALLAFSGAAQLDAQTQPAASPQNVAGLPLYPGMRVRVTSSSLVTPLVGSFLQSRGDTLFFTEEAAGRGVWSLPLNQISKLETTIGDQSSHPNKIRKGALWGAGIGALAFGVFAANSHPSDNTRQYNSFTTGLIGGVVGAGVGALVGMRMKGEKWRVLELPKKLSLVPEQHSRWRLQAALTF